MKYHISNIHKLSIFERKLGYRYKIPNLHFNISNRLSIGLVKSFLMTFHLLTGGVTSNGQRLIVAGGKIFETCAETIFIESLIICARK